MLFNSFEFIFVFLPLTLGLYFLVLRVAKAEAGLAVLVLASLLFYGYWNPAYLGLIISSILVNFFVGRRLSASSDDVAGKLWLAAGVSFNLGLLGYFKYANFFVDNINVLFQAGWQIEDIILPLAISFFTFQQISYLVDAWQGKTKEYNFLHYMLFVCFFPQLIAGPIVHHKEMLPQFARRENFSPRWENFAVGISIFAIGLFKKTVIADNLSLYARPVFDGPGSDLDLFMAWGASLAYTFQLYFDFSGYSDMAVGCARLFGIKLPVNFFSPYKAGNIIDFWRRWHITLSRFLRDYLYIPLGGGRKGKARRYLNLGLTMLLGGLWHGAGWTFVIWGGLHGLYLMINHAWLWLTGERRHWFWRSWVYRAGSWFFTFLAVVCGWVYFRAPSVERANEILLAMFGAQGMAIPAGVMARLGGLADNLQTLGVSVRQGGGGVLVENALWVIFAGTIAFLLPNVAQVFSRFEPVLYERAEKFNLDAGRWLSWRYSTAYAAMAALFMLFGVLTLTQVSEFLYFQF